MATLAITMLRTFPPFSEAKESTLEQLAPSCMFRSVSEGISINTIGKIPRYILCLSSGDIECWSQLGNSKTILTSVSAPFLLDISPAIQNIESKLDFVTRTQCEFIAIEAQAFIHSTKHDQSFCQIILDYTTRANIILTNCLINQKLFTAQQRLGRWIIDLIGDGDCLDGLKIAFTKSSLAYELGMSPANLSRFFKLIRAHGVAVSGSNITVTDIEKLKRFAS